MVSLSKTSWRAEVFGSVNLLSTQRSFPVSSDLGGCVYPASGHRDVGPSLSLYTSAALGGIHTLVRRWMAQHSQILTTEERTHTGDLARDMAMRIPVGEFHPGLEDRLPWKS